MDTKKLFEDMGLILDANFANACKIKSETLLEHAIESVPIQKTRATPEILFKSLMTKLDQSTATAATAATATAPPKNLSALFNEKRPVVKDEYEEKIPKKNTVVESPKVLSPLDAVYVKIAYNKHKMAYMESQKFLLHKYIYNALSDESEAEKKVIMDDMGIDFVKFSDPEPIENCNNPLINLLAEIDEVLMKSKFYCDKLEGAEIEYE